MRAGNEGILVALGMAAVAFVLLAVLKLLVG
jgi:hypothetical protein